MGPLPQEQQTFVKAGSGRRHRPATSQL
jgi:hypothetical protein